MNLNEYEKITERLRGFYPKMSMPDAWSKLLWSTCKYQKLEVVLEAIGAYASSNNMPPTIDKIKLEIQSVIKHKPALAPKFKANQHEERTYKRIMRVSRIEFCMDVLGEETVKTEILGIVGTDKISDLVRKDRKWVPLYQAKLSELLILAQAHAPEEYQKRFHYKGFQLPFDTDPYAAMRFISMNLKEAA